MKPRLGLIFHLFVSSSRVQKKRAVLTVASIAWGSLALLLLLAFGEGLKTSISTAQHGLGSNLAILWPGNTSLTWEGLPAGRPIRPRIEDVATLKQRLSPLGDVAGEIHQTGVVVTYGNKTFTERVKGVSYGYGEMRNHIPAPDSRFLNTLDEQLRRRVAFLGDDIAVRLFGSEDPVGKQILIDTVPYTVVGVMKKKVMMGMYSGPDEDHISIPITTFREQYGRDQLGMIVVASNQPELILNAINEVKNGLSARYGFNPEDPRVFGTWNTVESFKITAYILIGIQMFLGIIGVLTLIIGGVGVANIMYAVVKERTKEIGIKMAMGARRSWITGPIVLEGLLYTLIGGAAGVLMAIIIILLLDQLPTENNEALAMLGKPTLSLSIALVSAAVLGLIGITAGYFPARRAASINPAETLHYE